MLKLIDNFLNSITMYRLTLYCLLSLAGISIIFSFFNLTHYSPISQAISLSVFVFSCYIFNKILSRIFKSPENIESFAITALILFFIVSPAQNLEQFFFVILISLIAMASKYLLAIKGKHLFNPAAIAVAIIAFTGLTGASWWIALPILTIPTLIIGFLIVRKLRRFSLFFAFFITAVMELFIYSYFSNISVTKTLYLAFSAYPILFFGAVMLTEPLTTPPTRKKQIIYGVLIGLIFSSRIKLDFISSSPEIALIIGNAFSYLVSFRQKVILTLKEKEKLSSSIYNFVFKQSTKIKFKPGQYLEWTLPHKNSDSRGNRRYFTIASSPTENDLMLGVRIDKKSSSFKRTLLELSSKNRVSVGNLSGDFVLPNNKEEKLVFLAGGIGITPFRSMIKYLIDKKESRDIVLFHTCSNEKDFVYDDVFEKAQKEINLKLNCLLDEKEDYSNEYKGKFGHLTTKIIKTSVPDYKNRRYYISGSSKMVDAYKNILKTVGIRKSKIVTDYFSGY